MKSQLYEPVIGLEIHTQLMTKTKEKANPQLVNKILRIEID